MSGRDLPDAILRPEFEGFIRRHEDDENAHSAERHQQNSELAARFYSLEKEIKDMQKWQSAHDIVHATATGEIAGMTRTLRWGFGALGALITLVGLVGVPVLIKVIS